MRKLFVLLSSLSLSLSASLYVPEKLGSVAVLNSPQGFAVLKDSKIHYLGAEAVDSTLRKMDFKQRNMYLLKGGSLALNQTKEGYFVLRAAPKLKGGGPVSGAIAYWVTKSFCWAGVGITATAATAGVITAAVATGGAAVGASAAAVASVTAGASAAAGVAVGSMGAGAAGAAGATIIAAAAAPIAGATAAATTVTTGAAIAVGGAGIVASIETASLAAGAALTLCPFLP
jgi:hypothetical protein